MWFHCDLLQFLLWFLLCLLLCDAGALSLRLRVSTTPRVVFRNVPFGANVVSTRLIRSEHRSLLSDALLDRIKTRIPPVPSMRMHVHRRSRCDWVTALEVKTYAGTSHRCLIQTHSVRDALEDVFQATHEVDDISYSAKAVGLI